MSEFTFDGIDIGENELTQIIIGQFTPGEINNVDDYRKEYYGAIFTHGEFSLENKIKLVQACPSYAKLFSEDDPVITSLIARFNPKYISSLVVPFGSSSLDLLHETNLLDKANLSLVNECAVKKFIMDYYKKHLRFIQHYNVFMYNTIHLIANTNVSDFDEEFEKVVDRIMDVWGFTPCHILDCGVVNDATITLMKKAISNQEPFAKSRFEHYAFRSNMEEMYNHPEIQKAIKRKILTTETL